VKVFASEARRGAARHTTINHLVAHSQFNITSRASGGPAADSASRSLASNGAQRCHPHKPATTTPQDLKAASPSTDYLREL